VIGAARPDSGVGRRRSASRTTDGEEQREEQRAKRKAKSEVDELDRERRSERRARVCSRSRYGAYRIAASSAASAAAFPQLPCRTARTGTGRRAIEGLQGHPVSIRRGPVQALQARPHRSIHAPSHACKLGSGMTLERKKFLPEPRLGSIERDAVADGSGAQPPAHMLFSPKSFSLASTHNRRRPRTQPARTTAPTAPTAPTAAAEKPDGFSAVLLSLSLSRVGHAYLFFLEEQVHGGKKKEEKKKKKRKEKKKSRRSEARLYVPGISPPACRGSLPRCMPFRRKTSPRVRRAHHRSLRWKADRPTADLRPVPSISTSAIGQENNTRTSEPHPHEKRRRRWARRSSTSRQTPRGPELRYPWPPRISCQMRTSARPSTCTRFSARAVAVTDVRHAAYVHMWVALQVCKSVGITEERLIMCNRRQLFRRPPSMQAVRTKPGVYARCDGSDVCSQQQPAQRLTPTLPSMLKSTRGGKKEGKTMSPGTSLADRQRRRNERTKERKKKKNTIRLRVPTDTRSRGPSRRLADVLTIVLARP